MVVDDVVVLLEVVLVHEDLAVLEVILESVLEVVVVIESVVIIDVVVGDQFLPISRLVKSKHLSFFLSQRQPFL